MAGRAVDELGGDRLARRAMQEFVEVPFSVDQKVKGLLERAMERVPVVIVTNAKDTLDEHLERVGLTGFAHAVISSAQVGVAKPDRRIYELAAEAAGVGPRSCVLIDDRRENVEVALALGMAGIHITTATDLHLLEAPAAAR